MIHANKTYNSLSRFYLQCDHEPGMGFRRGMYRCVCADGFYFHRNISSNSYLHFYNGSEVEHDYYLFLLNKSDAYNRSYQCLPCAKGCAKKGCIDDRPCLVEYDVMMRGIPLALQSFCMTISIVLGVIIIRLRKSKVSGHFMLFVFFVKQRLDPPYCTIWRSVTSSPKVDFSKILFANEMKSLSWRCPLTPRTYSQQKKAKAKKIKEQLSKIKESATNIIETFRFRSMWTRLNSSSVNRL